MLFPKGVQRSADQVGQWRLMPIVVPQQVVRRCERMQSSNKGFAFAGGPRKV